MKNSAKQPRVKLAVKACNLVPGFNNFYQQFVLKMTIAQNKENTLRVYGFQLAKIAFYYNKSPSLLTIDEIESYLFYLLKTTPDISISHFSDCICAIRFFLRMEGKDDTALKIPSVKTPQKLPVILSKEEVVKMLNHPNQLKHRIAISLLYGCGLRNPELSNLSVNEIDFDRFVLHVKNGKGGKDRYVPIGKTILKDLKIYIDIVKPTERLLSGINKSKKVGKFTTDSIYKVVKKIARSIGIKKNITVHSLRHTFATHLLEDGLDIISIRDLLGHSHLNTTLKYLQVAQLNPSRKFSPIDNLAGINNMAGGQLSFNFKG